MGEFSGLGMHLGNLSRLSSAQSRSISPENRTGEVGKGGMATEGTGKHRARGLGQGWKVSPSLEIQPGEVCVLADIAGSGAIQQMWMTNMYGRWRNLIIRIHWDNQQHPSVECPLGDFFANGWERYAHVNSQPVCVNPGRAFNCYWEMPFRERAIVTLENRDDVPIILYYQINYTLTPVPHDCAYVHAQFRRTNPVKYKDDFTILDGVNGRGHYVGTYMAWGVNSNGWWGEGEIKFFMDSDTNFPTICGTGTEDYFCGSYDFDIGLNEPQDYPRAYTEFSTAYAGLPQVIRPDGVYRSTMRFGMYRWHILDPIRFENKLRVTMQDLGWRTDTDRRYLARQDDIASVAFWYQTLPFAKFPDLPDRDYLEVI